MFMGALAGFAVGVATRQPLARAARRRCWPAALLACSTPCDHPAPGRPDRVRPGADVPGHGPRAVLGEGLSSAGAVAPLPRLTDPAAVRDPAPRADLLHRPERAGLRRVPAGAGRRGTGSTARGRGSICAPSASTQPPPTRWASTSYRLRYGYVFTGGMLAGPRGRDDHAGHLARLVRRPDHLRPRLDRHRPGDLRPVEPAARGARGLPVRGHLPAHHRHPGPAASSVPEPVPGLPSRRSSWTCCRTPGHRRDGPRLARGDEATRRRAGRAGHAVRPGRAGGLCAGPAAWRARYSSSGASRPSNSIWT